MVLQKYEGDINDTNFNIKRIISYRNFFRPDIHIQLVDENYVVAVKLKM